MFIENDLEHSSQEIIIACPDSYQYIQTKKIKLLEVQLFLKEKT